MAADDTFAALERLARLRADGIISEAEFAAEKAAVLAGRTAQATLMPPQVYTQPLPAASPTILYAPPPPRRGLFRRWFRYGGIAILVLLLLEVIKYLPRGAAGSATVAACDSQDARDVLKDAFEHSAAEKLTNLRLLDIANMVERSYDPAKAQRICAADVTLNSGDQHVGYRLYKASNGRDLLVETMDDPGPSAAPAAAPASTPTAADKSNEVANTLKEMATTQPNPRGPPLTQQELLAVGTLAQALTTPRTPLPCVRNPGVPAESAQALTCLNQGRRYTMPAVIAGLPTSYRAVDRLPEESDVDRAQDGMQQP